MMVDGSAMGADTSKRMKLCDAAVEHERKAVDHAKEALEHAKHAAAMTRGETKKSADMLVDQVEKRVELAQSALEQAIRARDECHKTEKQIRRTQNVDKK